MNQRLARGLVCAESRRWCLIPKDKARAVGLASGAAFAPRARRAAEGVFSIERLQMVGQPEQEVQTVAVGCGAAGELLDAARQSACDAMVLASAFS